MSEDPDPLLTPAAPLTKDSASFYYAGATHDIKEVARTIGLSYQDSAGKNEWARLYASNERLVSNEHPVLNKENISRGIMPDVKGMGLKDALYLLEGMDLRVAATGRGKVKVQSIQPGAALSKHETILIQLD